MSQEKTSKERTGIHARVDRETYKDLTLLKIDLGLNSLSETLSLLAEATLEDISANEMKEVRDKMKQKKDRK